MITENLSQSVGSADPTTSPCTGKWSGMQVRIVRSERAGEPFLVTFVWEQYTLQATLIRKMVGRGHRETYWVFTTHGLETPTVNLSHELPVLAAFLLECNRRLVAATGERINQRMLEI